MGFWSRLFRRQPTSRQVAKERLQLVLVHDRVKISPGLLQAMKDELLGVISKYVEIDAQSVEMSLIQGPHQNRLTVDIPVSGPARRMPQPAVADPAEAG